MTTRRTFVTAAGVVAGAATFGWALSARAQGAPIATLKVLCG